MYIGRFAPTPSGPLHFGSIVAALGGYLDARKQAGQWLVRIDDLDTPRVRPGAGDSILRTLELLGMHWDGPVQYQSMRHAAYQGALDYLKTKQLVFACVCPRRLVRHGPYPGTCRSRNHNPTGKHALRIIVDDGAIRYQDRVLGEITHDLRHTTGDFIIRRSDNFFAYHLATVIDDNDLRITDIVRGGDLIDATLCQIYLQECLDLPRPDYCHLPIAVDAAGKKLSKSDRAQAALLKTSPARVLISVLRFLGQTPDPALAGCLTTEIIDWGISNWDIVKVPRARELAVADSCPDG